MAACRGHAAVIQVLFEWKAKPNLGDNQGRTPLIKVRILFVSAAFNFRIGS